MSRPLFRNIQSQAVPKPKSLEEMSMEERIKHKLLGLGFTNFLMKEPIVGPVVTGYPIQPSLATSVKNLINKQEDLALACGVENVTIVRSGLDVIIYVPNKDKQIVAFQDALFWYLKDETAKSMTLPLLLGTDTKGARAVIDLAKQPHILIAGSTGSGKSVFEANLITSLAMMKSPNDLHMYLVDTKRLDLPLFAKLPHVKDIARAAEDFYSIINILIGAVEHRNRRMEMEGVRNIAEYNALGKDYLPHILLIIDELSDLIEKDNVIRAEENKIARNEHANPKVIDSIKRLIQICRASGVHVIACTQRTSVDVVSGIVKANFPARISLKLPAAIDSKVILDCSGAEALLGNGDMLVKDANREEIVRYHAPFVRLEDIAMIISQMDMIKQSLGV